MLESMKLSGASAVLFALAASFCFSQETADPWPKTAVIEPAQLAKILESGKAPMVISVAFPVLYRARHVVHAIQAGPAASPEGIAALKKAVANVPKDADIVVYCGCCPMDKCPNIRPAYRTLKELGFTHIRVLDLPDNLHTDWSEKNYPTESGAKDVK